MAEVGLTAHAKTSGNRGVHVYARITPTHEFQDVRHGVIGVARELERRVVLSVLDRKWREHLYEMDYLKEGIGLRAMAQRDPLVEYQREGFQLFEAMNEAIKEESVAYLFNTEVQVPSVPESTTQPKSVDALLGGDSGEARPKISAKGLEEGTPERRLHYSAPSEDGGVEEREDGVSATAGTTRAQRRAAAKKERKKAKKQKVKRAKQKVKKAVSFIFDFEDAVAHAAQQRGVDGVVCGHIHWA